VGAALQLQSALREIIWYPDLVFVDEGST